MKNFKIFAFLSTLCLFIRANAQDTIDEDLLFSDTNTIIESAHLVDSSLSISSVESTHVGFSGNINSVADFGFSREFFKDFSRKQISPSAYIVSNLLLDIRLPKDVKAFGNVETQYYADSSDVNFYLKELFLDANIKRRIYFRTGKQVLQWGRCYFWNPTDMINVERKTVEPRIGYREGAYGVKMHVPFGTKYNLYGFIDMKHISAVDSIAGAFRSEMLIGTTEIGAEVWGKRNKEPIFGMDFSTTIFDFEFNGEISLENGKNYTIVNGLQENEPLYDFLSRSNTNDSVRMESTIGNKPVPKICIGVSKSFDLLSVKDRVRVISEFYYNKAGVPGDFFREHKVRESLEMLNGLPKDTSSSSDTLSQRVDKLMSRFANPNNFSRYYLSLFTTINKFIISDITFEFNGIVNLEQKAATVITALQYATIHNLNIGLVFSSAVGSKDSEYTVFQNAFSTRLNIGVSF